jgi:hypothetical protein
LINADAVKDGRELVAVLGVVDLVWVGTKHGDARLLEPESDVLRQLSCFDQPPFEAASAVDSPPTLTTTPSAASSS